MLPKPRTGSVAVAPTRCQLGNERRMTILTHSVPTGIGELADDRLAEAPLRALHLHCGAHLQERETSSAQQTNATQV